MVSHDDDATLYDGTGTIRGNSATVVYRSAPFEDDDDGPLNEARENLDATILRISKMLVTGRTSFSTIRLEDIKNLSDAMYNLVQARSDLRFIDGA